MIEDKPGNGDGVDSNCYHGGPGYWVDSDELLKICGYNITFGEGGYKLIIN